MRVGEGRVAMVEKVEKGWEKGCGWYTLIKGGLYASGDQGRDARE